MPATSAIFMILPCSFIWLDANFAQKKAALRLRSSRLSHSCSFVSQFQSRYDLKLGLTKNDIHIIDGYVGKGYGLSSQEEIEVIKRVALMEGVALDPVYTGKAMYGLTEQIRKGTFKQAQKILFLHTGGIFGLFPKASLFFLISLIGCRHPQV